MLEIARDLNTLGVLVSVNRHSGTRGIAGTFLGESHIYRKRSAGSSMEILWILDHHDLICKASIFWSAPLDSHLDGKLKSILYPPEV